MNTGILCNCSIGERVEHQTEITVPAFTCVDLRAPTNIIFLLYDHWCCGPRPAGPGRRRRIQGTRPARGNANAHLAWHASLRCRSGSHVHRARVGFKAGARSYNGARGERRLKIATGQSTGTRRNSAAKCTSLSSLSLVARLE